MKYVRDNEPLCFREGGQDESLCLTSGRESGLGEVHPTTWATHVTQAPSVIASSRNTLERLFDDRQQGVRVLSFCVLACSLACFISFFQYISKLQQQYKYFGKHTVNRLFFVATEICLCVEEQLHNSLTDLQFCFVVLMAGGRGFGELLSVIPNK